MTVRRPGIAGTSFVVREEIDALQHTVRRYQEGRIPDAVFLEYRLRHGIYGQRQDGVHMLRSKLPLGLLSPEQLEAFADIADRFGHGVAHLTTRQDIQVHFVALDRTPDLLRVLADAEGTAREACGNVVRNVTAAPDAGIAPDEPFDVTPWGMWLAQGLLRHPDGQSLGRKFKIVLVGHPGSVWDLARIHDLAATAVVRDGRPGFEVRAGGGLGAVPHVAPILAEWIPATELLPLALAVLRVFARHGEKAKRARARLKFLVADQGIAWFRAAVAEERLLLPPIEGPTGTDVWTDAPLRPPAPEIPEPRSRAEARWRRDSLVPQRQPGYVAVRIRVPRGDLDPAQLRGLAVLLRTEVGDTLRIAPDQSLLLRFVAGDRVPAVYDALGALELARAGAGGIGDPVTCPGADTCKLGITSPRALARQIEGRLDALATDDRVAGLRIHVSGCPNACAQTHIADIGLFGAARSIEGRAAPHYIVLLGGRRDGTTFGMPVTRVPAVRVGDAIERLVSAFADESGPDESFPAWVDRRGRPALKLLLEDLDGLPPFADAPEAWREHGRDEVFAVRRGVGECAGEVVLHVDLLLTEADREAERALVAFETGDPAEASRLSLAAMLAAARALLSLDGPVPVDDDSVTRAFGERFVDGGRFFEGIGHYLRQASAEAPPGGDRLRRRIIESGLFVEEAHTVVARHRSPARGVA